LQCQPGLEHNKLDRVWWIRKVKKVKLTGVKHMPPVKVKVKFFAPFRELFGAKEKELVFNENPDLIELLDRLAETPAARPEIFKDGQVRSDLVIMINGSIVSHDTLTGLKIEDGATVTIFPLMGGG